MINIVDAIEGGTVIRPLSRSEEWHFHPANRTSETGQRLLQKLNENKEYLMLPTTYIANNKRFNCELFN